MTTLTYQASGHPDKFVQLCVLRELCLRHCTNVILCTVWITLYSNDGCWT